MIKKSEPWCPGGWTVTRGGPCLVVEVEKIRWPELYVFGCDSGNIGGRG